jgi:hypothetical protein
MIMSVRPRMIFSECSILCSNRLLNVKAKALVFIPASLYWFPFKGNNSLHSWEMMMM